MLRIITAVDRSQIHGLGLFACNFVPKGMITWKRDLKFDISFDMNEFLSCFDKPFRAFKQTDEELRHSYYDLSEKRWVRCGDDIRFINHSEAPNITSSPSLDVAAVDIYPGEELLCNYECFEPGWFERRGLDKNFQPASRNKIYITA